MQGPWSRTIPDCTSSKKANANLRQEWVSRREGRGDHTGPPRSLHGSDFFYIQISVVIHLHSQLGWIENHLSMSYLYMSIWYTSRDKYLCEVSQYPIGWGPRQSNECHCPYHSATLSQTQCDQLHHTCLHIHGLYTLKPRAEINSSSLTMLLAGYVVIAMGDAAIDLGEHWEPCQGFEQHKHGDNFTNPSATSDWWTSEIQKKDGWSGAIALCPCVTSSV